MGVSVMNDAETQLLSTDISNMNLAQMEIEMTNATKDLKRRCPVA
jgi:hypothetical protein